MFVSNPIADGLMRRRITVNRREYTFQMPEGTISYLVTLLNLFLVNFGVLVTFLYDGIEGCCEFFAAAFAEVSPYVNGLGPNSASFSSRE